MGRLLDELGRWLIYGRRTLWTVAVLAVVLGGCRAEVVGRWASDSAGGEVAASVDSALTVDHYRRRALKAEVQLYCLENTVSDTLRIARALETCKYPHHHEGGP